MARSCGKPVVITTTVSGSTGLPTVTAITVSPSNDNTTTTASTDSSSGLSPGAIAGIVIGVILGIATLILAIVLVMRKRRGKPDTVPSDVAELDSAAKPISELPPDDLATDSWNKLKHREHDLSELASEPDIVELASDPHMQHRGPHELPSPTDQSSVKGFLSVSAAPTPSLDQALRESPSQNALGGDDTSTLAASTRGEELSTLEQRQTQLAERKRRLMEIDEIEAEAAEISRRMARLRDGDGSSDNLG